QVEEYAFPERREYPAAEAEIEIALADVLRPLLAEIVRRIRESREAPVIEHVMGIAGVDRRPEDILRMRLQEAERHFAAQPVAGDIDPGHARQAERRGDARAAARRKVAIDRARIDAAFVRDIETAFAVTLAVEQVEEEAAERDFGAGRPGRNPVVGHACEGLGRLTRSAGAPEADPAGGNVGLAESQARRDVTAAGQEPGVGGRRPRRRQADPERLAARAGD